MNILVTGGAGFIGSYLCEYLLNKGHGVVCLDNLVTGARSNISHLEDKTDFRFMEADISETAALDIPVDYVFHFASPASPIDFSKLSVEIMKVGSIGTLNSLEIARANNAGFIVASTSEVYGDPLENPQREEYRGNVSTTGPRSVYDEAKRFGEAMTMAYRRRHGLNTHIVRIFNTYGPGMRRNDGRVIPNFISQALNDEPLTIYGDGSQTRSFCYVSDLVEGIYRLAMSDVFMPVNIGNPHEITVLTLAETILKLTGSRSQLDYRPLPQDDPLLRQPDISKAKELLNWQPQVSLEDGLGKTITAYRDGG